MTTRIQPQHITFGDLIHGRLFRIPDYQRAYSWGTSNRQDLFEDLERTSVAGGDRGHFMSTVVGLRREKRTIIANEYQVVDIVDGQQRLTTLVMLLKSISKVLDRDNDVGRDIGQEIDRVLVKPDEASLLLLQTNHDSSDYFADYLRKGSNPNPRDATTLADREILRAIRDCERFVSRWQQSNPIVPLYALIKNRLTFIFHEIEDEGAVYTVFDVLNSRGLDVSHVDRLKSQLMGIIFDSESGNPGELIDGVHSLWGDVYRCIGLRQGMSTEALRFAATLQNPNQISRTLGEEDSVDVLTKRAAESPLKVIETTKWFLEVTRAVDKLRSDNRRSAVTDIAQARLLATAILLRSDLSEAERQHLLRAWESVTFRIYGLGRKDSRWAVGDYVRLAWQTVTPKISAGDILKRILPIGQGHSAEQSVDELKGRAWYPHWSEDVRYFFARYEEHLAKEAGQRFNSQHWNHIWESSTVDSIEHILPQSSGDEEWLHSIGNLLLLPPEINSQLGAKRPADKAAYYQQTGLLIAQEVAPHLQNWNRAAIERREKALLDWAVQEWADPV